MKKIFTLLFSVGILSVAAFAQPGSRDNRDKPTYDQRTTQPNSQRDNDGYSNGMMTATTMTTVMVKSTAISQVAWKYRLQRSTVSMISRFSG